MRVRDLGVIELEIAGRATELRGPRLLAALTVLLLEPGRPVAADTLVEALWGDGRPPRSAAALDTVIWRLRAILEPDRPPRRPSTVLPSVVGGFRLDLPSSAVDSWDLEEAAARSGRTDSTADLAALLHLTGDALERWRGTPFSGVEVVDADGRVDDRRAVLAQARLALWERHAALLLRSGDPDAVVTALPTVLAEHRHAETLWAYLILAHYRAGRPAAALAAHQQIRTRLADELGVAPGPQLSELQLRLLQHDPTLFTDHLDPGTPPTATVGASVGAPTFPPLRSALPRRTDSLIGRDADLDRVVALLASSDVVTVTGPVGCGKTRLAIAAAGRAGDSFPDGVHFVDLSDVTDPQTVPDRVSAALTLDGGPEMRVMDRLVGYLRDRRVLLVIDNCEQIVDAVAGLVQTARDGGFAGRVLITSRRPLDTDGERIYPLGPLPIPSSDETRIPVLVANPAVRLFLDRMTPGAMARRTAEERWEAAGPHLSAADVVAVCRATDGLPLALELVAARARVLALPEVASLVAEDVIGLGSSARSRARPGEGRSLRASIDASHRLLTPGQRLLHRRMSVLAGPSSLDAISSTSADQLTQHQVFDAVVGLVDHSMLEREPSLDPGVSHFRQLLPVRAHAAEHLAAAGETAIARSGVRAFVLDLVRAGQHMGAPGQLAWYTRLDGHRRLVTETLAAALAEQPDDDILETVGHLTGFWLDRLGNADGLRIVDDARVAVARRNSAGDPVDPWVVTVVVAARVCLVAANQRVADVADEIDRVIAHLAAAAVGARRRTAAWWLVLLALCCWAGDDFARAGVARARARVIADTVDDVRLRIALDGIAAAGTLVTDPVAGEAAGASVLAAADTADDDFGRLLASLVLSVAARFRADGALGLRWSTTLLRVQQRLGVRNIADTLETRGNHHATVGDPVSAVRCYGAAAEQNMRNGRGFPRHPGTAELLADCRALLSADRFAQAWTAGGRVAVDHPAVVEL